MMSFLCEVLTPEKIALIASPEVQNYILEHQDRNVQQLILSNTRVNGIETKYLASQIQARKKALSKLPSWAEISGIVYPETLAMEQCSSEVTARYKHKLISKGSTITDLTGGFGVDSFWLSEGASSLDYVEQQEYLCDLVRHNFPALGRTQFRVFNQHLEEYLDFWKYNPTSIVYCDPARRNENQRKVFLLEDCSPNVEELAQQVISTGATLICKLSPMFDISRLVNIFGLSLSEIHVVAVKNECKELVMVLSPNSNGTKVYCVNLQSEHAEVELKFEEIGFTTPEVSVPLSYLYEANAAIMKAGAADIVAVQKKLVKLQANSHLYSSVSYVENFPGRIFEIRKVMSLDKKELTAFIPSKKANISTRNFPLKPEEIYKKIGFTEGGEEYLFATTLHDGKKVIICCRKLVPTKRRD